MHDPRTHLYRDIHKAIRLLLGELSALAGSTDFSSVVELDALRAKVRRDFGLLTSHAHHEDRFIEPLLRTHAPELARRLAAAHDEQEMTMPALERQLAAIDPAAGDVSEACDAFRVALSRYVASQLTHMSDEEQLAMPALYGAVDDAALIDVHHAIVSSISPSELMEWYAYMIPGMDTPSRTGMLMGMREAAPPEVFAAVLDVARRVLDGRAFADLELRLGLAPERAA